MSDARSENAGAAKSPLSAERLRQAFSQMLGKAPAEEGVSAKQAKDEPTRSADLLADDDRCEINPRSIVEAMLFVGRADGRPLSAREMAAAMRGVSPREVDAAIDDLRDIYLQDRAPYEVADGPEGYRLVLSEEYSRMRDKFHGRVQQARLSPPAMEVLSIVAYHQPVTLGRIDQLRGAASGHLLRSLVRRQLVRVERPADRPRKPDYSTTERFLRLFRLGSLDELPRGAELEAA